VTYAPVLLALSAVEALIRWFMPETAQVHAGAIASLRPHVHVPAQASQSPARVTPVIASWALGGFYCSLMPALMRVARGVTLPVAGGLVVGALTSSGAISVVSLRSPSPDRMLNGGIVTLSTGVAMNPLSIRRHHRSRQDSGRPCRPRLDRTLYHPRQWLTRETKSREAS
jgi:hypothetical protein